MIPKTFSVDMREDGGARVALSYRAAERRGIQRLSCDIAGGDLVRLVLFSETLGLQAFLGVPVDAELELEGLYVDTDGAGGGIRLVRRQGHTTQEAWMDLGAFASEMSVTAETCLARAAESKHGAVLAGILEESPMPSVIAERLDADRADQCFYAIREMALLILCEEADRKGSDLARKVRAKKRREDARQDVHAVLDALSSAFLLRAGEGRAEADLRLRG